MEQDSLSSTFCGSTVYAAPEILIAGGAYDPRWVDSWSCGIVLYAMLTAKMPFSRNVLTKFVKYRYVEGQFGKAGCVFLMVIWSEFRTKQYRDDEHREDAPHYIRGNK